MVSRTDFRFRRSRKRRRHQRGRTIRSVACTDDVADAADDPDAPDDTDADDVANGDADNGPRSYGLTESLRHRDVVIASENYATAGQRERCATPCAAVLPDVRFRTRTISSAANAP